MAGERQNAGNAKPANIPLCALEGSKSDFMNVVISRVNSDFADPRDEFAIKTCSRLAIERSSTETCNNLQATEGCCANR